MAFEASEKRSISKILGANAIELDAHLAYHASRIDEGVETDVRAEIERWNSGIGTKFVTVEPNTKNFGAKIDPEAAKQDIRQNIKVLLCMDLADGTAGASDSFEIARG